MIVQIACSNSTKSLTDFWLVVYKFLTRWHVGFHICSCTCIWKYNPLREVLSSVAKRTLKKESKFVQQESPYDLLESIRCQIKDEKWGNARLKPNIIKSFEPYYTPPISYLESSSLTYCADETRRVSAGHGERRRWVRGWHAPFKGIRIPKSGKCLLVELRNPSNAYCGIQNPRFWNPEYSSKNPESSTGNPESTAWSPRFPYMARLLMPPMTQWNVEYKIRRAVDTFLFRVSLGPFINHII